MKTRRHLPISILRAFDAQRKSKLKAAKASKTGGPCFDYIYKEDIVDGDYEFHYKMVAAARGDTATLTISVFGTYDEPTIQTLEFQYDSNTPITYYPGCPMKGWRYKFDDFECGSDTPTPFFLFLGDDLMTDEYSGAQGFYVGIVWGPNLEREDDRWIAQRTAC